MIIFLLAMLLLIFKSLFGVIVWKCQIVKIWFFFEEHGQWKYFYFLQANDHFFNDTMICNILPNMCLILLNLFSYFLCFPVAKFSILVKVNDCITTIRPWHDVSVIAHTCSITIANQEKGGLRGWKTSLNVKLHGLTSSTQNSNSSFRIHFNWFSRIHFKLLILTLLFKVFIF